MCTTLEDGTDRRSKREVAMLEIQITPDRVRAVAKEVGSAIQFFHDTRGLQPRLDDNTTLTVENLVDLLLPLDAESTHYVELVTLSHPSSFTISSRSLSSAVVQVNSLCSLPLTRS